jgi:hypothetical protein
LKQQSQQLLNKHFEETLSWLPNATKLSTADTASKDINKKFNYKALPME